MELKRENQTSIAIDELRALLERVRQQQLSTSDLLLIERALLLIMNLSELLQRKRVGIKQIRAWFFSSDKKASNEEAEKDKELSSEQTEVQSSGEQTTAAERRPRAPGHGRNGADAYRGAKKVYCRHEELQSGSPCPDKLCPGHLYEVKRPAKFIRLEGQPLIGATRYEQQILKCSKCDLQCIAKLPAGATPEKYDASADAAIVLAKYGSGIPFYRLERLQARFGVPLPASVQWERVESTANILLPVFFLLQTLAATAAVLYQDDTNVRILKCQPSKADKRKGIRTTAMIAECDEYRIALFASGRNHAGDNANELLAKRSKELGPIIKMSDALKLNLSQTGEAIISLCLTHGRQKFVELKAFYPQECGRVIDDIGKIYENEAQTKRMTPAERLQYHQLHSRPIMEQLKRWIEEQFEKRLVEPNDALGGAYNYLLRNWEGLTQFLRTEKCPLDNNIVERALKTVVLHRKNSLFFRNDYGAYTSDVLMSVVESCKLNGIEPFDYLTAVIRNQAAVRANPADWLPWGWSARSAADGVKTQTTLRQSSGKEARSGFP